MAIILFILAAVVLLVSVFSFFQTRQKERSSFNNEELFTDAWTRIDNKTVGVNNTQQSSQSTRKNFSKKIKNNDPDFLSDILLRTFKSRRSYYRDVYLKSDAWQRKRYVVLKRDNWRCVYC